MGEKLIQVDDLIECVSNQMPLGYVEDNNLKVFLDQTIDLREVVSDIQDNLCKEDTNEIKLNE